mmetsp:Transcript_93518/g.260412  ORF Transcript_93518/g.260412 Transcript_93518/m.260412 type:complete len:214 (-) Transcript_93518:148-789(-)
MAVSVPDACTSLEADSGEWVIRASLAGIYAVSVAGSKKTWQRQGYHASMAGLWLASGNEKSTLFTVLGEEQGDYIDWVASPDEAMTLSVETDAGCCDTYRLQVEAQTSTTGKVYYRFNCIQKVEAAHAVYAVQSFTEDIDGLNVIVARLSGETTTVQVKADANWADLKDKIEKQIRQETGMETQVRLIAPDGSLLLPDDGIAISNAIPTSTPA